jgi:SAM-dependent methyltransferase
MIGLDKKTEFPAIERDLEILSHSANYLNWIYMLSHPFIGSRILEVGSGIGNYTEYLLKHGAVFASDMEDLYLERLKKRFGSYDILIDKVVLGQWSPDLKQRLKRFNPDTIICFNVLEHVQNDLSATRDMMEILSQNGNLILIIPALELLFSPIDRNYGHYRRYDRKRIIHTCRDVNADLRYFRYFNFVGFLGWIWNYKIMRKQSLNEGQVRMFDRLVPLISKAENYFRPPVGLSIIAVMQRGKNEQQIDMPIL